MIPPNYSYTPSIMLPCPLQHISSGCEPEEKRCSDGTCISLNFVCDGLRDCPEGEDEPEGCDPIISEQKHPTLGSVPMSKPYPPFEIIAVVRRGITVSEDHCIITSLCSCSRS